MKQQALKFLLVTIVQLKIAFMMNNGLGKRPPMGWSSWNHYGCQGINQQIVKDNAKKMKEIGLLEWGYEYIILDDCWQLHRNDQSKQIEADPIAFPDGIPALSKYIHDLGFKFGLYSDAGVETCQGRPGSLGYEEIDAKTYAEWGVDYVKYDNCYNLDQPPQPRYEKMSKALNATGRPMFFSVCEQGKDKPWEWAPVLANSWRTTEHMKDSWSSFMDVLNKQVNLYPYAKVGAWNDPDMLQVGNRGMTTIQYQTQFAFWSLLKAPLILGNDVVNMTDEIENIVNNPEVILVNQDPLGYQGFQLFASQPSDKKQYQIWGVPQINDSTVILVFNTGNQVDEFHVNFDFIVQRFSDVGYPCALKNKAYSRDLIRHRDDPTFTGVVFDLLNPNQVYMKQLTPVYEKNEVQF